jgi:hypothetical protein
VRNPVVNNGLMTGSVPAGSAGHGSVTLYMNGGKFGYTYDMMSIEQVTARGSTVSPDFLDPPPLEFSGRNGRFAVELRRRKGGQS